MRTLTEIVAQTIEKLKVDIVAQTLSQLAVDIVAQTLSQLNVNIAAQTATLDVQVLGTASVSIDAQNVILDVEQKDDLYTYKRMEPDIVTDSEIEAPVGYGVYIDKGCRGILSAFKIYVKNLTGSDQTVTIALRRTPSGADLYEFDIPIPASQTDYDYAPKWYLNIEWNYDSLFWYVKNCPSGVWFAYKYDASAMRGGYKADGVNTRYYFPFVLYINARAKNTLPISGTVNTIAIPNKASFKKVAGEDVDPGETVTLIDAKGTGSCDYLVLHSYDLPHNYGYWIIEVDGKEFINENISTYYTFSGYVVGGHGNKFVCTVYDDTNYQYMFLINMRIQFQRRFTVKFKNTSPSIKALVYAFAFLSTIA